jgi:hypothetical protein
MSCGHLERAESPDLSDHFLNGSTDRRTRLHTKRRADRAASSVRLTPSGGAAEFSWELPTNVLSDRLQRRASWP